MKRLVSVFLACLICWSPLQAVSAEPMRRGLFVSVIQDPPVLNGRQSILQLVDYARQANVGILFVQIYRANMAWFPSTVADMAPYKTALNNVGEDPLALLIREAHRYGIEVHAWLNLFSLAENANAPFLKKYGLSILTTNVHPKKRLADYKIDDQYFLEPSDQRVQAALSLVQEEILRAYPSLDGIQFDYIRYPDTKPAYGYSPDNVERFRKVTGIKQFNEKTPAWQTWKREQVTLFLKRLVRQARELRPGIHVSATGCMPYARAYYEAFQDWPAWIDKGIVDFVTLMNYSTDLVEYQRWVGDAMGRVKDDGRVNMAIGAYKSSGPVDIFSQEFGICEKSGAGACVAFHYGSLLDNQTANQFFVNSKR
ncbi:MAG: family 10 glycosylhydrolase [Candidatus Omnitrophica bacterium]|nr:family 10 glycosylhydrolase [Candidatus Omnitrophota bacterium]